MAIRIQFQFQIFKMNSITTIASGVLLLIIFFVGEVKLVSRPSTAEELQSVLNEAEPGDTINLLPMKYHGNFIISKSGTEENPIKIKGRKTGSSHTILSSGSGTVVKIQGNFVHFGRVTIKDSDIGVYAEGNNIRVDRSKIENVRQGVVVNGTNNVVKRCDIKSKSNGIIILGGGENNIERVLVNSVNIMQDACCNLIEESTIKGLVEFRSGKNTIKSVMVQEIDISGEGGNVLKNMQAGTVNVLKDACCNSLDSMQMKNLYINSSKNKLKALRVGGETKIEGCDTEIKYAAFEGPTSISKCSCPPSNDEGSSCKYSIRP